MRGGGAVYTEKKTSRLNCSCSQTVIEQRVDGFIRRPDSATERLLLGAMRNDASFTDRRGDDAQL